MRLGRFANGSLALAIDDGPSTHVLDVAATILGTESAVQIEPLVDVLGPSLDGSWRPLIECWDDLRKPLQHLAKRASAGEFASTVYEPESVKLAAPVTCPTMRVFALGGNFTKHVQDASREALGIEDDHDGAFARRRAQGPWGFMVLPETLTGPDTEIHPPRGIAKVDYEGEVAAILAKGDRDAASSDLRVWGFTAFNDFSLRDTAFALGDPYDAGPMSWTLQKNFDTGSSCGPWVVVDEPLDVDRLEISLRVNGENRQQGNTSEMIFSFAETYEHLSRFLTLRAGDMIVSGTPSGTALESGVDGPFLRDGDVTELEVQAVGPLRNTIVIDA